MNREIAYNLLSFLCGLIIGAILIRYGIGF
jgi:hypothetical protein